MNLFMEILIAVLIVIGAAFTFLGSVGLVRLRDFYERLHTPTKATTLGVGSLLIASAVFFSWQEPGWSFHEVLVAVFLFITAPVSAHVMAKAALHLREHGETDLPTETTLAKHDGAAESGYGSERAPHRDQSAADDAARIQPLPPSAVAWKQDH
jgi:multicomponent K+:H+ antiporter subunit G